MSDWHNDCGTAHCLAGWAVTLHPDGQRLEKLLSTPTAATLLIPEVAHLFYEADKDKVLSDVKKLVADNGNQLRKATPK
jgi:hypothetical protein